MAFECGYSVQVVVNDNRRTEMKIRFNADFNFTPNWRRFDVSMQEKHIAYRNVILEDCVCLAIKIKC